ncbi:MAG: VCBS repeat-containing protein, partial [Bacteroidetes bacterium]|nr:VCBS repeat-containing protein [Bacteroidota bacterium]
LTKIFTDVTAVSGISFVHHEDDFIDFKDEPLLPYQLSRQGPALAKADVNGDGLEDIFIGGAIGQPGVLYLQTDDGKFVAASSQPWSDSVNEQVNAIFFDVDNDGDLDLYIVSGGNEYADQSAGYEDHIYINDGKGNFTKAPSSCLPRMLSSKFAITAGDFNNDGKIDLFIGGRGIPASFPLSSRSYLLRNDSKNGVVQFTDVTNEVCPLLLQPGMVSAASWVNIDNDQYPELIVAGDWMPVMLFKNNKGQLEDASEKSGLKDLNGMWASITPADVDGDGKIDFILGNCGYNNQFKASKNQPMTMYAADFDDNGTIDPIICYYIQGKSYPMASRDELLDQIVSLKKKFVKYKNYADATIEDIFPKEKIQNAKFFHCDEFASGILYNNGNNSFSFHPLPLAAQFSKVFGAVADDFDKDGKKDILLSGNFYPYRTSLGQCDASLGLLLKGNNNKLFEAVDPFISGCYIDGDVRAMTEVKTKSGEKLIIVAKNNSAVQVLKLK